MSREFQIADMARCLPLIGLLRDFHPWWMALPFVYGLTCALTCWLDD